MAIPPYYPNDLPSGVLFSNQSCADDFTSASVSVQGYRWMSFVFTWTGFTSADSTMVLQVSNDNSNWVDKTGATYTFAASSGTQGISLNGVVTEAWYRFVYTDNANAGGTMTCIVVGKGP